MLSRKAVLLILGICLCVIAAPRAAFAHAVLVDSTPPDQTRLERSPAEIVLRFNEPVRAITVRLLNPLGQDLLDPGRVSTADEILRAALPEALPQGTYVFSYRVISTDSHPVGGSLVFSVGAPLAPGGEVLASPAAGASWWQDAIIANRMLYLVSLAVALGAVLFFLLIGFEHGAPALRSRAIIHAGGALSALTLVLSIGLEGAGIADAPITRLLDAGLWRLGLATTGGTAAIMALLGLGLVVGSSYSPRLRQRKAKLALRLGAALVLASFVLSGHAATAAPGWLARPIWLAHVTVALFWIGSLLPLLHVLRHKEGSAHAVRRFSAVAVIAVPAMLAAGAAMAALQMQAWAPLFGSDYGRWLTAKLVLVAMLLALAAYNRARLVPHLEADETARKRFTLTVRTELLIGMAVFCAAAGLSHQIPPRALLRGEIAKEAHAFISSGGWTAEITVTPAKAGRNDISVSFSDRKRRSIDALEVNIAFSNPARGVEPFSRRMEQLAPGMYRAVGSDIPFAGQWEICVDALISDFDKLTFSAEVSIR